MTPETQALVTRAEAWLRNQETFQVQDEPEYSLIRQLVAALVQQAEHHKNLKANEARVREQYLARLEAAEAALVQQAQEAEPEAEECPHDLAERETAVADGFCPQCLQAQLARVTTERDELNQKALFWVGQYEKLEDKLEAAEAALSAHREALEKLVEEWLELGRRECPLESAPITQEKRDRVAKWMMYTNRANELKSKLAALASPRQAEQEHDKNDDHTRVVDSSQPDRAALPQRPTS